MLRDALPPAALEDQIVESAGSSPDLSRDMQLSKQPVAFVRVH